MVKQNKTKGKENHNYNIKTISMFKLILLLQKAMNSQLNKKNNNNWNFLVKLGINCLLCDTLKFGLAWYKYKPEGQ